MLLLRRRGRRRRSRRRKCVCVCERERERGREDEIVFYWRVEFFMGIYDDDGDGDDRGFGRRGSRLWADYVNDRS
jgi:hypothetical protein